ncbi:hypothetical protein ODU07_04740 [Streptococcus suis]|nr:hypothetical protein [Streptococcus suis]
MNKELFDSNELSDFGLEVLEVDSSTVLDEMGASQGHNSCSQVVQI